LRIIPYPHQIAYEVVNLHNVFIGRSHWHLGVCSHIWCLISLSTRHRHILDILRATQNFWRGRSWLLQ
jgi:hypothetical protein